MKRVGGGHRGCPKGQVVRGPAGSEVPVRSHGLGRRLTSGCARVTDRGRPGGGHGTAEQPVAWSCPVIAAAIITPSPALTGVPAGRPPDGRRSMLPKESHPMAGGRWIADPGHGPRCGPLRQPLTPGRPESPITHWGPAEPVQSAPLDAGWLVTPCSVTGPGVRGEHRTDRAGDRDVTITDVPDVTPASTPGSCSQAVPPFPVLGWGVECTDVGSTQPKESRPASDDASALTDQGKVTPMPATRISPSSRPSSAPRPSPPGPHDGRRRGQDRGSGGRLAVAAPGVAVRPWPVLAGPVPGGVSGPPTGAGMVLNAPIVGHRRPARRPRLLGGRRRRGRLRLRRSAGFYGSTGSLHLNKPIVGMAPDPGRARATGRWPRDGGRLRLRRRRLLRLHRVATPRTSRSWASARRRTAAATGWWPRTAGVFAFGDAQFYGSATGMSPDSPIVGMASTARRPRLLGGGADGVGLRLR